MIHFVNLLIFLQVLHIIFQPINRYLIPLSLIMLYLFQEKITNLINIIFNNNNSKQSTPPKMLTQSQQNKNCQTFISQIHNTQLYQNFKNLLYEWKEKNKNIFTTIDIFVKITKLINQSTNTDLYNEFNRCLVKQYTGNCEEEEEKDMSPEQESPAVKVNFNEKNSISKIVKVASQHSNSNLILDAMLCWLKSEASTTNSQPVFNLPSLFKNPHQIEQLSEQQFSNRLQRHSHSSQIAKLLYLYRKSIITLKEFKSLLDPIYLSDPSCFNMLYQYAEETETVRRKNTIFAPLNQLVDQKYPMKQVGNSYVAMPDGYANWGSHWQTNELEKVMNRICLSVPLGSEVSFVITRKNQFEEQLFKNEEDKYEIDINIQLIQAAIKLVEKSSLKNSLVQKILVQIYPNQILNLILKHSNSQLNNTIVLPRLRQKLLELQKCRSKFEKQCQEVASKNFYKSLDYRCFYFCKNDKKFNSTQRWQKQIQMRKKELLQENNVKQEKHEIEDRQSLQKTRNFAFNSFDNITKQQFIKCKNIPLNYPKKMDSTYPRYPHNQILFIFQFQHPDILNDALQIILYHTQKKQLLENLLFKMLRISVSRKLTKDNSIIQFIESQRQNTNENSSFSVSQNHQIQPLNEQKVIKKNYRDIHAQFIDLIEQDIEPAKVEEIEFPFQGPEENTFIGTKQCYFFLRYLVTIYQRLLKAKLLSEQRIKLKLMSVEQPSLYSQFLTILSFKLKEQKSFEDYLRRIYQQDAFIFFTLDKLISGITKLVNNINSDSLTHKILKQGMKDYQIDLRKWKDYKYPTFTEQITRVSQESEGLFRFSCQQSQGLVFVSAWDNQMSDVKKKEQDGQSHEGVEAYMSNPSKTSKPTGGSKAEHLAESQYLHDEHSNLIMRGQTTYLNRKRSASQDISNLDKQLRKYKRMKLF